MGLAQVDNKALTKFLKGLLHRQLDQASWQWLTTKLDNLNNDPQLRNFYLTFSAVPRYLGKASLQLTPEDIHQVSALRPGFQMNGWTISQTGRALVVCAYPYSDPETFIKIIDQLFSTAEVSELVALYSALPVMPYPEKLKARASEGIRTNMSVVFDAVVLNNPYPSKYLDEGAWNQMVLKALFMERPLFRIYGLEERSNLSLSKMISDYAHERWAAGRPTSPEMWRPIMEHGTISIYQDLEQLIALDDPDQQSAAILAAKALNTRESQAFLDQNDSLVKQLENASITWDKIGERWWSKQQMN